MWGMIAKITAVAGKRDSLIAILGRNSRTMPGCLSYIVCEDDTDENVVWVTEAWQDEASHNSSLMLPVVQEAVREAKPMVAAFARIATTHPRAGVAPA